MERISDKPVVVERTVGTFDVEVSLVDEVVDRTRRGVVVDDPTLIVLVLVVEVSLGPEPIVVGRVEFMVVDSTRRGVVIDNPIPVVLVVDTG